MDSIISNFFINEKGNINCKKNVKLSFFNDLQNTHYIGLGGAGCNIIEYLQKKRIKAKFTCITNPHRPNLSNEIKFINFRAKYSDIHDTELSSDIKNICNKNEKYILFCGLGGNTGTFLTEKITAFLFENDTSFMIIASLPFSFEGPECQSIANLAAQKLQKYPNFYCYTFEEVKNLRNKKMGFNELFEQVNEMVYSLCLTNS